MNNIAQSPFAVHSKLNEHDELATKEDEDNESRPIHKMQNAFQFYSKHAHLRLKKTEDFISNMSADDQRLLSKYRKHLGSVRSCINHNQALIQEILRRSPYAADPDNEETPAQLRNGELEQAPNIVAADDAQVVDAAQAALKSITRDWSADGALEREQSYKPIIDTIKEYYKPSEHELNEIKILVPGAGLGRLTYELACSGYACEGNEFSYFMLMASNFMLNLCDYENKYVLYPWVHQYVNNMRRADQVAAVRFPDVCPKKNPPKGNIDMAAGDFLEVYKTPNSYNCVATCFFIDCANNVIEFIRTIYHILVPGGIWVNLGPLLYHYSEVSGEQSVEPSYEDLLFIMENVGFDILSTRTGVRTKYAQNPHSIKQSEYESLFWVCKKPTSFEQERTQRSNSVGQQVPADLIVRRRCLSNSQSDTASLQDDQDDDDDMEDDFETEDNVEEEKRAESEEETDEGERRGRSSKCDIIAAKSI